LEGGEVWHGVNLAAFRVRWFEVVVIVEEEWWRGGSGDDGDIVGDVMNDVEGGGGWRNRPFSFRLKTGRSPKYRMHLTERQTANSGNVRVL
jgi:hypothetical protein